VPDRDEMMRRAEGAMDEAMDRICAALRGERCALVYGPWVEVSRGTGRGTWTRHLPTRERGLTVTEYGDGSAWWYYVHGWAVHRPTRTSLMPPPDENGYCPTAEEAMQRVDDYVRREGDCILLDTVTAADPGEGETDEAPAG